jgi:hypothetical protein
MTDEIQITKDFPPSRERAVLLELLAVTQALQKEGIDAVVCGGWVPFLKELARDSQSGHSMSFDIDVLLRSKARERESVDRIKALLSKALAYEADKNASFRYQKTIEGNPIQLDLLADVARIKRDEAILKIQGVTTVGHYREDSKDAYDIYYYCRYSEDATSIREMLAKALAEPAIARTVQDLKAKFTDTDSRWVEMILDEMSLHDEERDREAQFVVRTMKRVVENL